MTRFLFVLLVANMAQAQAQDVGACFSTVFKNEKIEFQDKSGEAWYRLSSYQAHLQSGASMLVGPNGAYEIKEKSYHRDSAAAYFQLPGSSTPYALMGATLSNKAKIVKASETSEFSYLKRINNDTMRTLTVKAFGDKIGEIKGSPLDIKEKLVYIRLEDMQFFLQRQGLNLEWPSKESLISEFQKRNADLKKEKQELQDLKGKKYVPSYVTTQSQVLDHQIAENIAEIEKIKSGYQQPKTVATLPQYMRPEMLEYFGQIAKACSGVSPKNSPLQKLVESFQNLSETPANTEAASKFKQPDGTPVTPRVTK